MIHLLPVEALQNIAGRKSYLRLSSFHFTHLNGHTTSVLLVWFEVGIILVQPVSSKHLVKVCKEWNYLFNLREIISPATQHSKQQMTHFWNLNTKAMAYLNCYMNILRCCYVPRNHLKSWWHDDLGLRTGKSQAAGWWRRNCHGVRSTPCYSTSL
jgi:hypothetical protein